MCYIGSYKQVHFDQCFLDFGEDFREYLFTCTCLDTVLFVKIYQLCLSHVMEAKKCGMLLRCTCYFVLRSVLSGLIGECL